MKLSRRGKRTKCAKRFKLKRNTKKQFRQYKRKNTYRKRSHKLRKSKRVMRGGVDLDLFSSPPKTYTLKYKTDDSSFMNRARGFMDKFQEGTFTASLSFDGGDEGNKNKFDIGNSVFQKNYTVNGKKGIQYPDMDVFPKNAQYHFTLMMGKEKKTFTVKFTLTVKQYRVSLVTYTKYTTIPVKEYNPLNNNPFNNNFQKKTKFMDLGEKETKFTLNKSSIEITYSDGTGEKTTILGEGGKKVDSISIKSNNESNNESNNDKTYTFPFPHDKNNDYSKNYSFFWKVLDSCKEKVYNLMKTEIGKINPVYEVNPNVNEYPSRIIQPPTDTPTPTPAPEGLEPSDPVSVEYDDEQPQQQLTV
jgi:hypothetical protein